MIISLYLASANARGLRFESRRAKLFIELQRLGVNICYVQETRYSTRDYEGILSRFFICHVLMDAREVSPGW